MKRFEIISTTDYETDKDKKGHICCAATLSEVMKIEFEGYFYREVKGTDCYDIVVIDKDTNEIHYFWFRFG